MDSNIKVTIGIPFYNAEQYLRYAIQSVLNQTFHDFELILSDDGSTDSSIEIARSFDDPRIVILSDGKNRGLVYRLNEQIHFAKGMYFVRMDADDIMHFNRIAIQLDYLKSNSEVDVVGTSYYSIDTSNQIIGKTIVNNKPYSVSSVLKGGCFAHPTIMGKTEWFRKNPYDESWIRMEDVELWLRTISFSRFSNLSVPLLYYRSIGVPTLKKYIKSNIGIIKLLQKRNIYKISISDSIYYSISYCLKIIVYVIFYCFGQMGYLIAMRSKNISTDEVKKATKDLIESIK